MEQTNLYIFNPTCEIAVANGSPSYQPPQILKILEDDLSSIPMFLSSANDYILGLQKPRNQHVKFLQSIYFPTPTFISESEIEESNTLNFNKIIPWGWSPACHQKLKNIKQKTSNSFHRSKVFNWNNKHRLLYERKSSAQFLQSFLNEFSANDLINSDHTPEQFTAISAIENYLNHHDKIVLKAPLSSSGRGIQMIRKGKLTDSNKKWIESILKQQSYLMAEPLFDKKIDFSMHFEIENDTMVNYLGYSIFETTPNGMFIGSLLNTNIEELLTDTNISSNKINELAEKLGKHLKNSVYSKYYEGKLGIDAMIIMSDNKLQIHPCVEINCRLNMGIIAKQIEKFIHKDAKGSFEIFPDTRGSFNDFSLKMQKEKPLIIKEKKVIKGFIPITDPLKSKKFGAYVLLN